MPEQQQRTTQIDHDEVVVASKSISRQTNVTLGLAIMVGGAFAYGALELGGIKSDLSTLPSIKKSIESVETELRSNGRSIDRVSIKAEQIPGLAARIQILEHKEANASARNTIIDARVTEIEKRLRKLEGR